jgi:hypothetical protein
MMRINMVFSSVNDNENMAVLTNPLLAAKAVVPASISRQDLV